MALAIAASASCSDDPEPVNPTAEPYEQFEQRVATYVALRDSLAAKMGPLDVTKSQAEIAARAATLGNLIITARDSAKQGDVFDAAVAALMVTLIKQEFARRPPPVQEQREDAVEEVPGFTPAVNMIYPTTYPLATFPPTLLPLLPRLPEQVEYRIVAHYLILRDVEANLIVDYIPNAVPQE
jgi:hypothetical protein